ncbi:exopolysaccharide biosynthesis protein [Litchfieldella xinjiangensis]|uniref:exopolysaccharide biosynthesis protein n=1 Tax=Litchfieldella xinjiangensis TaxID=1166948 RepID=UPI000A643898|nr:exopolysaccharide biosynthesis protein [Halomonas xinjiangensis]
MNDETARRGQEPPQAHNLNELLDNIERFAPDCDQVTLDDLLSAVGRRSFGPFLLVAGLITLAPIISGIPGVPSLMAIMVLLVAVQLLMRREHFWLPAWLLKRSVSKRNMHKTIRWLRKPASYVDGLLRPRLVMLTGDVGIVVIAISCVVIAIAMPPMELVPFSVNGAGVALVAFGLALIARDGLLALLAFLAAGGTFTAVAVNVF